MDWSHLQHRIPFEQNFRWRGGQVSRVEAFADAVFALSIALFVVSTEVPTSYDELVTTLWAFPAFALSFILIVMVWVYHFIQFRRYGVEDATTMALTLLLLFVALFYVYPLKFMWAFLQTWAIEGIQVAQTTMDLNGDRVGDLLVIYGAGFVAMYVLLALMAMHCLKLRDQLELNEVEVYLTKTLIGSHLIMITAGALSVLLAMVLEPDLQGLAGMVYPFLGIAHPAYAAVTVRREKAIVRAMAERDAEVGVETTTATGAAAADVVDTGDAADAKDAADAARAAPVSEETGAAREDTPASPAE